VGRNQDGHAGRGNIFGESVNNGPRLKSKARRLRDAFGVLEGIRPTETGRENQESQYRISLISPFPEEDQTTKIKHILDNFECPQCRSLTDK